MDSKVAYFKSIKAKSVAIMGANNKEIFYNDRSVEITDPDDIYIYRKKTHLLVETDSGGVNVNLDPGTVVGQGGVIRPAPLSRSTYQGYEGAKRRQLEAELSMQRQETESKNDEVEDDGKASLDDELSAEDDLSIDGDDFNFEEGEKSEKKKAKVKKNNSKKKKVAKKKPIAKKKKSKPSNKKNSKKKLNKLREFSS